MRRITQDWPVPGFLEGGVSEEDGRRGECLTGASAQRSSKARHVPDDPRPKSKLGRLHAKSPGRTLVAAGQVGDHTAGTSRNLLAGAPDRRRLASSRPCLQ